MNGQNPVISEQKEPKNSLHKSHLVIRSPRLFHLFKILSFGDTAISAYIIPSGVGYKIMTSAILLNKTYRFIIFWKSSPVFYHVIKSAKIVTGVELLIRGSDSMFFWSEVPSKPTALPKDYGHQIPSSFDIRPTPLSFWTCARCHSQVFWSISIKFKVRAICALFTNTASKYICHV